VVGGIKAYPTGAPEGVCTSMIPAHGANAQTTPSPYTLDTTLMETNNVVTMQVTISSANVYRGFLVVGNEGTGTFTSLPSGSQSVCGQSLGVTHTANNDKSNMTFTWTTPSTFCGNVAFRATVVQTRAVFWTGIVSQTLQVNCTGARTLTTTASPGSSVVPNGQTTPRSSATQVTKMTLFQLIAFTVLLFLFCQRN